MPDVLVLGDINADLAASLPYYPVEGDDSPLNDLVWCSGGAAANTATALALLGGSAGLIGRVGRDPAAIIALRAATRAGVDLRLVQHDEQRATGLCLAAVSPGGQRTFFSYRGANVALDPALLHADDLRAVLLHICAHGLLEEPQRSTALRIFGLVPAQQMLFSLDLCAPAARLCRELVLSLLPQLALLFMNEDELALLLPGLHWRAALYTLREQGARLLVLKRGGAGCVVLTPREELLLSALPIEARDTTGCGDAFVAGFLWAYLRGATLAGCAAVASLVGGAVAMRVGAAEALPTLSELRGLLTEYPEWPGTGIARTMLDDEQTIVYGR